MKPLPVVPLLILLSAALAAGQAATNPTQPAATAPSGELLKVTVVSVAGPAQKMVASKDKPLWEVIQAGEELSEMTVIRTGLGAKVLLRFQDLAEVTVNNATKIGIGELRRTGEAAQANLGLKYGTLRASVQAGRGRNDFRVATPVATLSVRGSEADLGFMADSARLVDPLAGQWLVQKQQSLPGLPTYQAEQTILPNQTGNSSMDPPIFILAQEATVQPWDPFGVTPTEQTTMANNPTGRQSGNTPSTTTSGVQPPALPPPEPGYP